MFLRKTFSEDMHACQAPDLARFDVDECGRVIQIPELLTQLHVDSGQTVFALIQNHEQRGIIAATWRHRSELMDWAPVITRRLPQTNCRMGSNASPSTPEPNYSIHEQQIAVRLD